MKTLLPFLALLGLGLGACATPSQPPVPPVPDEEEPGVEPGEGIAALGTAGSLDFGTWNLEWFGDTGAGRGPDDDSLQAARVRHVMTGLELDLWSVQEVTDPAAFEALVSGLPGYDGLLANDPFVSGGPAYYSDFDGNEQKVGLVWRDDLFDVEGARVILTDENYAFAGRPPVEVRMTVTAPGATEDLVVVLLHAKAGDGRDDRDRRAAGAAALEAYLDATWPDEHVLVIGDFNDDVDTSITDGMESSYANFVTHPAWSFPTAALSATGRSSTVYYPDVIDHHLVSDELLRAYVEGSVDVFRGETWREDYGPTTSDHYPVVTRWRMPGTGAWH